MQKRNARFISYKNKQKQQDLISENQEMTNFHAFEYKAASLHSAK